jgi:uncharacterized protein YbjT (DUF2867 family)
MSYAKFGADMRIVVLGASGTTGRLLVTEALARGVEVVAIARDPSQLPARPDLIRVAGDVHDSGSIARAVRGGDVLLSGLGISKGGRPGTLTAGAKAAASVPRVIWLGAYGTGESAGAAGLLTRTALAVVLRGELPDKVVADGLVLASGGTVFHAGPLTGGPASTERRTLPLDEAPRRMFPARVSRATVAAAMVDEAISPRFGGKIVIPLNV